MTRTRTEAAQAAATIRKQLKSNGIPASVTSDNYSMGSSVTVTLNDPMPATLEAVEKFAAKFQYGSFDGMRDIYNSDNVRDDIPQAKYVSVSPRYSAELKQAAYDYLRGHLVGYEDAPESYDDAQHQMINNEWVSQTVYRTLRGAMNTRFWSTRKPHLVFAAA